MKRKNKDRETDRQMNRQSDTLDRRPPSNEHRLAHATLNAECQDARDLVNFERRAHVRVRWLFREVYSWATAPTL